ncbi:hypothetical protein PIB30_034610 [Stylosanthes scabra]|uniref:AP complex mu/sigma subunit domain-containing protein n=1 Tax=Stylosanthes scabra TaxID=79078 RepID=A0ABU6WB93_9FABA|nr:hypothetical protein [Stylosanthes scabra]
MVCCTLIRYWRRRGGEQLFQPHFSPDAGEMVPGIAEGHVTLGSGEMEKKSISLVGTASCRQGKVRLTKWYSPYSQKERSKVCELDLIFNFHKAYFILDEILLAGEMQETSKRTTLRLIAAQEELLEAAKEEASSLSSIIAQATK